jgi:hypothetical protein
LSAAAKVEQVGLADNGGKLALQELPNVCAAAAGAKVAVTAVKMRLLEACGF